MNWDDYRYFNAIGRAGSVRGAAEVLRVNPSTVTRRLEALEAHLGLQLFARSGHGLTITPEARGILDQLDSVDEQLQAVESSLLGRDQRAAGAVRVALPDVLALEFVLADSADFVANYPDIDLQFIPAFRELSLAPGEVDIAIRATEHPPEDMIGRPLGNIALAVYAHKFFLEATSDGLPDPLPWVDWAVQGEVPSFYEAIRNQYFPAADIQIRCDHIMMQQACIRAGMGVGVLPCFLGDPNPDFVKMEQVPVQSGPTLWLLSHPALRGARRIQLFVEHLTEVFQQRRSQLAGGI